MPEDISKEELLVELNKIKDIYNGICKKKYESYELYILTSDMIHDLGSFAHKLSEFEAKEKTEFEPDAIKVDITSMINEGKK